MKRIHAYVEGRVQGVWFRETTRKTAVRLGLNGWVRNLADGRVEVVAEGPAEALDSFAIYLRRGPERAQVLSLGLAEEPFTGEFNTFGILPTEDR